MKKKKILKILLMLCLILISLDQISKVLIKNYINGDINLISNNVVSIVKVENEGFAFGINKQNMANICISLGVIIFIFNYIFSQKEKLNSKIIVFLGLIIAGGLSNILDRIFYGAVFDFIKIGSFPVFNFADTFVVIGWLLFVINFVKETAFDIKVLKKS